MAKSKTTKLPKLIESKIYKTGQTRGADDDVIYQNRVNRNSTVLIPYPVYDICSQAPDNEGIFENGFIVLIRPDIYFMNDVLKKEMELKGLHLGKNALLFYETREQWNQYNPESLGLNAAISRKEPLSGDFVARVPSTTSKNDEKINLGFNTSGSKGAGIRVYEYASSEIFKRCRVQLEFLYWQCFDSKEISLAAGMSIENIELRIQENLHAAETLGLNHAKRLFEQRIIDKDNNTICPLCLEKLSAIGFFNKLEQAEGRDVPDLTVTQLNLFHINELKYGEFNHKPYNLGWGHHHCNVVTKDSGIFGTLKWMAEVIDRNEVNGFQIRQIN
jgi:hypothetical protein